MLRNHCIDRLNSLFLAAIFLPISAGVRVFTQWLATGLFTLSKAATKKKEKNAALQALQGLIQAQYKSE